MCSYQRRDTRSSSSSDYRRNSSRRNDNNRNRNNHGGNPHEPPRNNSRNNAQGNYNYGSPSNASSHAPSSLDKTLEAPETCRSPSLYTSLIMEYLRPPPRPLEPLQYATALRTMQTITQMHASRERFAQVAADRPMTVRQPSQFRLYHFRETKHGLPKPTALPPRLSVFYRSVWARVMPLPLAKTTRVVIVC